MTLSGLTVFKTAGFNRSPTPPFLSVSRKGWDFQQPILEACGPSINYGQAC